MIFLPSGREDYSYVFVPVAASIWVHQSKLEVSFPHLRAYPPLWHWWSTHGTTTSCVNHFGQFIVQPNRSVARIRWVGFRAWVLHETCNYSNFQSSWTFVYWWRFLPLTCENHVMEMYLLDTRSRARTWNKTLIASVVGSMCFFFHPFPRGASIGHSAQRHGCDLQVFLMTRVDKSHLSLQGVIFVLGIGKDAGKMLLLWFWLPSLSSSAKKKDHENPRVTRFRNKNVTFIMIN